MEYQRIKKWNTTAAYALMHIATWGFFAVLLSFSSNVLYEFGFSDSQISILLGISAAISFVMQLMIAELISRRPQVQVWGVLAGIASVILLGNVLLWMPKVPVLLAVCAFASACILLQMVPSLVNAVGMDTIKRGAPTNYSIARGLGSLGYSMYAYATGFLVRGHGVKMVPVMGGVCATMLLVSAVWYHVAAERDLPGIQAPQTQHQEEKGFLKKYPLFAVFLAASILLQFGHNIISNFMYQIMLTKNGTAAEQGVATAISALVELPVMFLFPVMMWKIRCDTWVRFAGLFILAKPLIILLSGSPEGIYVAQATQMIGYGLYTISSVNYAEMVVGRGESVRAQSYLGSTATVGGLLAMSTGGFICQHLGVPAMLMISFAVTIVGAVTIAFTAQKTKV